MEIERIEIQQKKDWVETQELKYRKRKIGLRQTNLIDGEKEAKMERRKRQ